jgi:hypothetical protein
MACPIADVDKFSLTLDKKFFGSFLAQKLRS